jgi:hypothetical protein
MGQGRRASPWGPAAARRGLLVAYALTITDLDPCATRSSSSAFLNPSGVDARLRHRLLHGPPERGDRLRPEAATARTSVARSSPSARFCPRPPCATWAACSRCPTGRWTAGQDDPK